jgi:hypothetical protein
MVKVIALYLQNLSKDGLDLPWDSEIMYNGDIVNWWLKENGFKSEVYEALYPSDGSESLLEDRSAPIMAYRDEREAFLRKVGEPPELVNVSSIDYLAYILAARGIGLSASRGCPKKIDPGMFSKLTNEKEKLLEFCNKYNIKFEGEPQRYLSSYWG